MKKTALLIMAAIAVSSVSAHAGSARVDITPQVGFLNPTQNNLDEAFAGVGSIVAKHTSSAAFGGKLTVWLNESFALEGTGFFVSGSSLDGQIFNAPAGSVDASFFYGTARAVLGLGSRAKFLLSAGMGFKSSNYDSPGIADGSFSVGILGAGAMIPLGDGVSLRFDMDDYIYNMYWEVDDLRSTEILQHDVMFLAGLTFHTGR